MEEDRFKKEFNRSNFCAYMRSTFTAKYLRHFHSFSADSYFRRNSEDSGEERILINEVLCSVA